MGDVDWAVTPAKKMGYKEGDLFIVTNTYNDGNFNLLPDIGDLVVLDEDDGTECPFFRVSVTNNLKGLERPAIQLSHLRKLEGQDDGE